MYIYIYVYIDVYLVDYTHIHARHIYLRMSIFLVFDIIFFQYFHCMISTTFEQFLLTPTFSRNVRECETDVPWNLGKSVVTYHRRRYWGISAICPGLHSSGRLDPFLLGFFVGRNPEVTYGGVVFLWKLIRIYRIVGWSARNRDMPYAWNIYDSDGWTLWDLQLKQPPCTPVGCLFHV